MLGQLGFYAVRSKEKSALAIQRFTEECDRLLGVMDRRLTDSPFLGGADFGIADITSYPWTQAAVTFLAEPLAATLPKIPAVTAWLHTVGARPAVQRAMTLKLDR